MRLLCYLFIISTIMVTACDNSDTTNACDTTLCEEWELCNDGICIPLEGLCTTYLHCTSTQYCDEEEHVCKGPTGPEASFFDGEGDRLLFAFRGRIGSSDEYAAGIATIGEGAYRWKRGSEELLIDYFSYAALVPPSMLSEAPEWDNTQAIVLGSTYVIENTQARTHYYTVSIGLSADNLYDWLYNWQFYGDVPHPVWATVNEISTFVREDKVSFRRSCYAAWMDEEESAGKLFLFAPENADFSEGEPLMVWGNFPLTTAVTVTEENEEVYCTFSRNGADISATEYHEGILSTGYELSCELPEEVTTPAGDDYVTMLFMGTVNDPAVGLANFDNGMGTINAEFDGTTHSLGDYYMLSYQYPMNSREYITIQGLGSAEVLGTDHFRYKMLRMHVSQEAWLTLQTSGDATMLPTAEEVMVSVEHNESFTYNGVNLYKVCPIAVYDTSAVNGLIGSCYKPQSTFAIGDNLEVAATFPMTTEHTALQAWYGTFDGCYCYNTVNSNRIPCSEFDGYVQGGTK